jgi:hypothetical protein
MANFIEKTNIKASKFVVPTSRYIDSQVVYYTDRKLITFELYVRSSIPTSSKDKYFVLTPGYEYRPDLLSQDAYGTPDFWWKIMQANGIYDIFDFISGLNVRIPSPF